MQITISAEPRTPKPRHQIRHGVGPLPAPRRVISTAGRPTLSISGHVTNSTANFVLSLCVCLPRPIARRTVVAVDWKLIGIARPPASIGSRHLVCVKKTLHLGPKNTSCCRLKHRQIIIVRQHAQHDIVLYHTRRINKLMTKCTSHEQISGF